MDYLRDESTAGPANSTAVATNRRKRIVGYYTKRLLGKWLRPATCACYVVECLLDGKKRRQGGSSMTAMPRHNLLAATDQALPDFKNRGKLSSAFR